MPLLIVFAFSASIFNGVQLDNLTWKTLKEEAIQLQLKSKPQDFEARFLTEKTRDSGYRKTPIIAMIHPRGHGIQREFASALQSDIVRTQGSAIPNFKLPTCSFKLLTHALNGVHSKQAQQ